MLTLETIGFEVLKPETKDNFQKLFQEYSKKIERKLKSAEKVKIHLKEYSPGGKTKYSMHAIVTYSGKSLEAEDADWDLRRVVHKVFKRIEEQAEHLFHISDQNKKKKRERRQLALE